MNSSAQSLDFPTPYDYRLALAQGSAGRGIAPQLKFRAGPMGLVMMAGANAAVLPAVLGEKTVALRLFTNPSAASRHRYAELTSHLNNQSVKSLAWIEWTDDGIEVDGDLYPALLMEWIEGVQLDQYVRQLADAHETQSLSQLANDFAGVADELFDARVAHGDLQHGNILIETGGGGIRLVDFDGVWVPALDGDLPDEAGHDSYQHPARRAGHLWNRYADTFPALVIYASLTAIANEPRLWSTFGEVGSHLILRDHDLVKPDRTSERWSALFESGEKDAVDLLFDLCTQQQPTVDQSLTSLIDGPADSSSSWWDLNSSPSRELSDPPTRQSQSPFSVAPDSPHGLAAAAQTPQSSGGGARPDPLMKAPAETQSSQRGVQAPKVKTEDWWGGEASESRSRGGGPHQPSPSGQIPTKSVSRPMQPKDSVKWWLRPGYVTLLLLAIVLALIIINQLAGG